MKRETIVGMVIGVGIAGLYSLAYAAYKRGFLAGAGIILILVGAVGTVHAVQAWRRTGLPLATAAIAVAAGTLIVAGSAMARGWDPRLDPKTALVLLAIFGIVPGLLMFAESRRSREKWKRWKEEGGPRSLLEFLTAGHIPYLR